MKKNAQNLKSQIKKAKKNIAALSKSSGSIHDKAILLEWYNKKIEQWKGELQQLDAIREEVVVAEVVSGN